MGGSSSSSRQTSNTTTSTSNQQLNIEDTSGTVLAGVDAGNILLTQTDHGAVSNALDAIANTTNTALEVNASVTADAGSIVRDIAGGSLGLAGDAINVNAGLVGQSFDLAELFGQLNAATAGDVIELSETSQALTANTIGDLATGYGNQVGDLATGYGNQVGDLAAGYGAQLSNLVAGFGDKLTEMLSTTQAATHGALQIAANVSAPDSGRFEQSLRYGSMAAVAIVVAGGLMVYLASRD